MILEQFLPKFLEGKLTEQQLSWYHATGLLDDEGVIRLVSRKHRQVTGFLPSEVIGTKLIDRIHEKDRENIREQHVIMVKTGKATECKFEVLYKNGLYYTVRSLVIPQYTEQGDYVGALLFGHKRSNEETYIPIEKYRKTHELSKLPFSIAI